MKYLIYFIRNIWKIITLKLVKWLIYGLFEYFKNSNNLFTYENYEDTHTMFLMGLSAAFVGSFIFMGKLYERWLLHDIQSKDITAKIGSEDPKSESELEALIATQDDIHFDMNIELSLILASCTLLCWSFLGLNLAYSFQASEIAFQAKQREFELRISELEFKWACTQISKILL